jgi:hypothetical protein
VKAPGATVPDWLCNYPAGVELSAPGVIVPQETLCDALDNDCDGFIDEHTTKPVGSVCEDGMGQGECRRKGMSRCQADPKQDAVCDFGGAVLKTPQNEVCDGLDNDCDGVVDESWDNPDGLATCADQRCTGVRDDLVQVGAFWVYRDEASRVDATAEAQGSSSARPCSRPGVMPWSLVNYEGARAACGKVGMRLCSGPEWTAACKGSQGCSGSLYFPYGCDFDPNRCNGAERGTGAAVPTASLNMCVATTTALDMSGNVAEWTSEPRGMIGGKRIFLLRGGSFNNYEPALRCESTLLAFGEDYSFTDAGFRCCSQCPPGKAECAGACTDFASDDRNCGACGTVCGAGTRCKNGKCQ